MKNLKYELLILLTITLITNALSTDATTLNGQVEQSELSGQTEQSSLRIQRGQNNLSGQTEGNLLRTSVSDTMPPVAPRRLYPLTPNSDNSRTNPLTADHGERPMGVLGCYTITPNLSSHKIIIQRVFPPSDLNRFGVQSGDQIIAADYHKFNAGDFLNYMVGVPGTVVNLTIRRGNEERTFPVRRIDARTVLPYDHVVGPSNNHYHEVAAMTRSW